MKELCLIFTMKIRGLETFDGFGNENESLWDEILGSWEHLL